LKSNWASKKAVDVTYFIIYVYSIKTILNHEISYIICYGDWIGASYNKSKSDRTDEADKKGNRKLQEVGVSVEPKAVTNNEIPAAAYCALIVDR
jgi:hypothetical protein